MPKLYLEITCVGIKPKSIKFRGNNGREIVSGSCRTIPNIWKYQKSEIQTLVDNYKRQELQISTSVVRWIIRDIVKNTRFFFMSLFNTYKFDLNLEIRDSLPITLVSVDAPLNYWTARHCIKSGITPNDLDFTLEENRLKNPLQFSALIRSADYDIERVSVENQIYLERDFVLESRDNGNDLDFSVEVSEICDAEIFHGRVPVEKETVLELSNRRSILVRRQPGYIDLIDGRIRVFNTFLGRKTLDKAIYLGTNSNWFHFIVEHAVRIVALPQAILTGTPIIVEKGLHPNILELCRVLTGVNPIQISVGEVISVEKLYLLREVGVVDPIDPVQRKNELCNFAELLLTKLPSTPSGYGSRVYLRRSKKLYRPLQNESSIARLLNSEGFTSVYPEQLQLHEIAEIMGNAQFIVAQSGAAITNLIFAKEGATFLEIWPPVGEGGPTWQPFVEIFGVKYIRIKGGKAKIGPKGYAFDGYKINKNELRELIRIRL